jgi:RNA polymerase sigma-70 factor (family 1)
MIPLDLETDIITRFRKGESRALTYVFKLHHNALCYFATQIIRDEQEARDIVADSFIKLWQRSKDFESLDKIRSFLYVATRNACFNFIKHIQRKNASHQEISYLEQESEDYIQSRIIKAELLQKIMFEVEALPPIRRKIFKMIYLEDLSIFEIATRLNISVDTVRVQKARALHFIRSTVLRKGMLIITLLACRGFFYN